MQVRDRLPPAHSGLPVEVPQRLHCHAQGALGEVQEEPLGMDLVSKGVTVGGSTVGKERSAVGCKRHFFNPFSLWNGPFQLFVRSTIVFFELGLVNLCLANSWYAESYWTRWSMENDRFKHILMIMLFEVINSPDYGTFIDRLRYLSLQDRGWQAGRPGGVCWRWRLWLPRPRGAQLEKGQVLAAQGILWKGERECGRRLITDWLYLFVGKMTRWFGAAQMWVIVSEWECLFISRFRYVS